MEGISDAFPGVAAHPDGATEDSSHEVGVEVGDCGQAGQDTEAAPGSGWENVAGCRCGAVEMDLLLKVPRSSGNAQDVATSAFAVEAVIMLVVFGGVVAVLARADSRCRVSRGAGGVQEKDMSVFPLSR
jgi:hypothetical protein